MFHLKKPEKEEQIKSKLSWRKGLIRITVKKSKKYKTNISEN